MIISDTYKYIFIELPRTGTTAISHRLCEDYEGESRFNKHTNLYQVKKKSQNEFSDYFIFSGIRHPMDRTVSVFEKYRTNYGDILESYTQKYREIPWWNLPARFIRHRMIRRVRYAQKPGMTFGRYFRKYYKAPYSDWAILDHKEMDAVIRFENLEEDFRGVCEQIGMPWKGEVGKKNVTTSKKKKKWEEFYDNELMKRATWVFSCFLYDFGYSFPGEKTPPRPSAVNRLAYRFVNMFRKFAWRHFSTGR